MTIEKAIELLDAQPAGDKILGTDPDTGKVVLARSGRYGPYVQLGEPEGKEKPKTASLLKSMTLDDLTLDQSLLLLTLPRTVGTDPDTGEQIVAQNGRYGPYLTRGGDRRSLGQKISCSPLTSKARLELFRQPPRRRGQRAAADAGRQVGNDPVSGKMITVRSGRFGPYVTDGETNASLRTGEDADEHHPRTGRRVADRPPRTCRLR